MIPVADQAAIDLAQIEIEERWAVAKADLVAVREVLAAARAGREPADPAAARRVSDWLGREGAPPDRDLIRRLGRREILARLDVPVRAGATYGALKVVRLLREEQRKGDGEIGVVVRYWLCLCTCGRQEEIPGKRLRFDGWAACASCRRAAKRRVASAKKRRA